MQNAPSFGSQVVSRGHTCICDTELIQNLNSRQYFKRTSVCKFMKIQQNLSVLVPVAAKDQIFLLACLIFIR